MRKGNERSMRRVSSDSATYVPAPARRMVRWLVSKERNSSRVPSTPASGDLPGVLIKKGLQYRSCGKPI